MLLINTEEKNLKCLRSHKRIFLLRRLQEVLGEILTAFGYS